MGFSVLAVGSKKRVYFLFQESIRLHIRKNKMKNGIYHTPKQNR